MLVDVLKLGIGKHVLLKKTKTNTKKKPRVSKITFAAQNDHQIPILPTDTCKTS